MKPLLLNTYDSGGAAKACIRLHEGLLSENVHSRLLFKQKISEYAIPFSYEIENEAKIRKSGNWSSKIRNKLESFNLLRNDRNYFKIRNKKLEMFSFPETKIDITKSNFFKEADLINLHWVSNFMDYSSFFRKTKIPIIWTLHDQNPFLGGEHYEEEFIGMNQSGIPIKRELTNYEKKLFKRILIRKKKYLENTKNLSFVALNDWMINKIKSNPIFSKFPVYKIPNGIDPNIFDSFEKQMARKKLGLPADKIIFLFVSERLSSFRKGYSFLIKSLKEIDNPDLVLCSLGKTDDEDFEDNRIIELGLISDQEKMALAYSAADAFVIPSLIDNLPNTCLESLLCGTPVIGFPSGGISEIINHGENGLLCEEVSSDALKNSIVEFINRNSDFNSDEIRKNAIDQYSVKVQVGSYLDLFETVINENK